MKERSLGLYLHIPFCLAKCHYCDFCSFPAVGEEEKHVYALALAKELEAGAAAADGYTVDTIFLGGGTPTCLAPNDLLYLGERIKACYPLAKEVEWTCEANPATVTRATLSAMKSVGFNRISLGMQSAFQNELTCLGRVHTPADLHEAVAAIREAGYTNWNLDLMFGIPHQTAAGFSAGLSEAIALGAPHLSVYSLQIEEGTPFYRDRATLPLPGEEEEEEMAAALYRQTEAAGYRRYEISNFAKPGYECRHNLRYWRMHDYLGFGIAAHSCLGGRRFYNRADLPAYLKAPTALREEEEVLTPAAREYETVMLGLRLADGIDEAAFSAAFGYGFYEKYGPRLRRFLASGHVTHDGQRTCLSRSGMAVSNAILAEILE